MEEVKTVEPYKLAKENKEVNAKTQSPIASVGSNITSPATTIRPASNSPTQPTTDIPTEDSGSGNTGEPKKNWFEKLQDAANANDTWNEQAQQEADAKRYGKQEVGSADVSSNFSAEKGLDGNLDKRIDDIIQQTAESGTNANAAMQNVNVPRNKMWTIRDIMNDPELEGMRDYLVADRLGTMWQNVGENLAGRTGNYQSKWEQYNDAMNKAYAENKANVDKSAVQANLDAINAGLAQQVALETSLADTAANTYIQRYKSLQDAETKRLVLKKMATDDSVWADLKDEEKLDLAAYMGILSGNYSLTELLIQKYAPQMLSLLDAFMDKMTDGKWSEWRNRQNQTGNPDAPESTPPTDEKKNDSPVTSTGKYITVPSARPIDMKDYEKNPNDYILFPTGNVDENGEEEYVISRKAGDVDATLGNENMSMPGWDFYKPTDEELNEYADILMNNPKLTDKERLKYAEQWGGKTSKYRGMLRIKVANKIATREAAEQEQQKLHDALFDLQKGLEKGKKSPDDVLSELWNYPTSSLSQEDQVLRQKILEAAYKAQVQTTYETVLNDKKMSPSNKIMEYDKILSGPGIKYCNPITKVQIERAKSDSEARRDYIDPLNTASNTWFGNKKVVGEDGIVRKGKSIVSNPSNTSYTTAKGVENALDDIEGLIYKIQGQLSGVDPQYYNLYVSKSNIGAYLKRYYDNGSMKTVAEKAGGDLYDRYDSLMYAIGNLIK